MKPCRTYRLKTLGSHNWAWAMGQYLWHSNLKTSRGGKEHAVNIQGKSKIVEVEDVAVDRWSTSPLFIWFQLFNHPFGAGIRTHASGYGRGHEARVLPPPPSDDFIPIGSLEVQSTLCFFGLIQGHFRENHRKTNRKPHVFFCFKCWHPFSWIVVGLECNLFYASGAASDPIGKHHFLVSGGCNNV